MKKGGGKQKGSSFERLVCKKLSLFLSNDQDDNLLWRSAMSGGRATVQLQQDIINKYQSGDISNISTDNILAHALIDLFMIECKFYKDLKLLSMIFGTPQVDSVLAFWNKLRVDSEAIGKEPMLIAKQNYLPIVLVIEYNSKLCGELKENFTETVGIFPKANAVMYEFEEFIKNNDPEILELLC